MYNRDEDFIDPEARNIEEHDNVTQQERSDALTMYYSQPMAYVPQQEMHYPIQYSVHTIDTHYPGMNTYPYMYYTPMYLLDSSRSQSSDMLLPQSYPQNDQSHFGHRLDATHYSHTTFLNQVPIRPRNDVASTTRQRICTKRKDNVRIDKLLLTNLYESLKSLSVDDQLKVIKNIPYDQALIMAHTTIDNVKHIEDPMKLDLLTIVQWIILAKIFHSFMEVTNALNMKYQVVRERLAKLGLSWNLLRAMNLKCAAIIKNLPNVYNISKSDYLTTPYDVLVQMRKINLRISKDNIYVFIKKFIKNEDFVEILREFYLSKNQFNKYTSELVRLLQEEFAFLSTEPIISKRYYSLTEIKDLCLLIHRVVGDERIDTYAALQIQNPTTVVVTDEITERQEVNQDLLNYDAENVDDISGWDGDDLLFQQLLSHLTEETTSPVRDCSQETVTNLFGMFSNSASSKPNTSQEIPVTIEDVSSSKRRRLDDELLVASTLVEHSPTKLSARLDSAPVATQQTNLPAVDLAEISDIDSYDLKELEDFNDEEFWANVGTI